MYWERKSKATTVIWSNTPHMNVMVALVQNEQLSWSSNNSVCHYQMHIIVDIDTQATNELLSSSRSLSVVCSMLIWCRDSSELAWGRRYQTRQPRYWSKRCARSCEKVQRRRRKISFHYNIRWATIRSNLQLLPNSNNPCFGRKSTDPLGHRIP